MLFILCEDLVEVIERVRVKVLYVGHLCRNYPLKALSFLLNFHVEVSFEVP
jgi:hypothetical protein